MRALVLLLLTTLVACRKDHPQATAAPEIRATPEGFAPVRARTGDLPAAMTATLWLAERAVHLSPDAPALLTAPSGEPDFAPTDKRDGKAMDLLLPKLQAALFEKHGDAGGGLLLHLDGRATFRMFVDVVFTAMQSGMTRAAVVVAEGKVIPLAFPKPRVPKLKMLGDDAEVVDQIEMKFPPTVLVVGDGYVVKSNGGSLAEGCENTGPGITIRGHDAKALAKCLHKIRAAVADYATERGVTFTANPNTAMQLVVDGWDAARAEGFTEISIAVPR